MRHTIDLFRRSDDESGYPSCSISGDEDGGLVARLGLVADEVGMSLHLGQQADYSKAELDFPGRGVPPHVLSMRRLPQFNAIGLYYHYLGASRVRRIPAGLLSGEKRDVEDPDLVSQADPCRLYLGRGLWMMPESEFVERFSEIGSLISIPRPDDRTGLHKNCIPEGHAYAVRWIAGKGAPVPGAPGNLRPYDGVCFKRVGVCVKPLDQLGDADLEHCFKNVRTIDGVRQYFVSAYQKPIEEIVTNTVTIWTVEVQPLWTRVMD